MYGPSNGYTQVLIPSRGSGKGDAKIIISKEEQLEFQSPLGEVVKETPG